HMQKEKPRTAFRIVSVEMYGFMGPCAGGAQLTPGADLARAVAAIAACNRGQLGECELRDRVVAIHQDRKRRRLALDIQASPHQLETLKLVSLGARETVVVSNVIFPPEQCHVGQARIQARDRGGGAQQPRLDQNLGMELAEPLGPVLHEARHLLLPPDPQRARRQRRRLEWHGLLGGGAFHQRQRGRHCRQGLYKHSNDSQGQSSFLSCSAINAGDNGRYRPSSLTALWPSRLSR